MVCVRTQGCLCPFLAWRNRSISTRWSLQRSHSTWRQFLWQLHQSQSRRQVRVLVLCFPFKLNIRSQSGRFPTPLRLGGKAACNYNLFSLILFQKSHPWLQVKLLKNWLLHAKTFTKVSRRVTVMRHMLSWWANHKFITWHWGSR